MDGSRRSRLKRKVLIRLIVLAAGAGLILLSLFAFQLGLDNNPGWGSRRFQILGAGIAVVLFGSLYWITPTLARWIGNSSPQRTGSIQNESTRVGKLFLIFRLSGRLGQSPWFRWVSRNLMNIGLVLTTCCALWMYVWIITIGRMDKWPSGREYYWMLTQAFEKGQTYLLVDPNPELLKLDNPYDLQQRKGLDYLWDTTLFKGKYYLYWGPVPAVLGVLVNFISSRPVTDAGLVFSFVVGTVLFSLLLLRRICLDYKFPDWVFWGGAIASAVNIPLIWLFTHPSYYEVSIAGGQFFLMAGFFLLYQAFRSSSLSLRYLFLSASAFGLAGGTRVNLLPSVVFLGMVLLWRIYIFSQRRFSISLPAFVTTLAPLVLIAISLAWYNYARFGSIFEFGHRYQLTGLSQTEDYRDQISVSYILPNLYTYLFRSPDWSATFPFVTIPWIKENMWPSFIRLPENYYYPEPTAGILFIVPLIGFTAILVIRLFWLLINGDISLLRKDQNSGTHQLFWLAFPMLGYVLIQMLLLFLFVSASLRYLFDLSPALIVLSTMFVGYYIQTFEDKSYQVKMIAVLWLCASVLTILFGFLVGLTGAQNNFLNKNPQLYQQLLGWFGG